VKQQQFDVIRPFLYFCKLSPPPLPVKSCACVCLNAFDALKLAAQLHRNLTAVEGEWRTFHLETRQNWLEQLTKKVYKRMVFNKQYLLEIVSLQLEYKIINDWHFSQITIAIGGVSIAFLIPQGYRGAPLQINCQSRPSGSISVWIPLWGIRSPSNSPGKRYVHL